MNDELRQLKTVLTPNFCFLSESNMTGCDWFEISCEYCFMRRLLSLQKLAQTCISSYYVFELSDCRQLLNIMNNSQSAKSKVANICGTARFTRKTSYVDQMTTTRQTRLKQC